MPVHDFRQSFNAGELDPLLDCRVAIEKYQAGLKQCINFIPTSAGPLVKRAGTIYIADQHAGTGSAARVVGFNFGAEEYGVFEIASTSVKIWSSSTAYAGAYSLGLYWQASHLDRVKFCQINNIIYGVHPDNPVIRFTRASASSFSVAADFSWTYPPMLDENTADVTLTCSHTSGSGRTLTASAATFTIESLGAYYEICHPRGSTFAEVVMGDDQSYAKKNLTLSAQPADGDKLTIDGRELVFRTAGRDAVDEIDAGETADDTADNIIAAINTGAGGALPFENVRAEEVGGLKAVAYIGNTTGTNFSDNETVTIGTTVYKFQQSSDGINDPYEVLLGASLQASLTNLKRAINLEPVSDPDASELDYFTRDSAGNETLEHPDVEGVEVVASGGKYYLKVQAKKQGAAGNSIALAETASNSAWYSDTLLSSATSYLSGGTRVISVIAKIPGTDGNSIAISETSSALAWEGGATTLSGGALDSTTTSSSVQVVGKWEVRTTGRWNGTLYLEKERVIGGGTWDVIHSWKSQFDHNVQFEGSDIQRASYRLRFVGVGDDIDGVFPRAILEPADAFIRGLVKVTGYTSTTQVTVTVVNDLAETTATAVWSEGAWSPRRGYPRAVCFHQNRLWFAGTEYEPFKLWASALGDFENFRYSSLDDGAMSFQIASTDIQAILWLASASDGLIVGTTSAEWVAYEADGQNAITPTNPPIFRQVSAYGSADVQGIVVGEGVVFIERHGRRVRRIGKDQGGSYSTGNLTALAGHICYSGVKSLAVQRLPETIIWAMREEGGDFVCLTFDPEQNVFAWAQHTGAECSFESVAVVSGPDGDELWFSADVNGTRAILRTDPVTLNRNPAEYAADEAIYVDCAVVKSGAAFTTVTLPACLVGCEVVVKYANGTTQTVSPSSTTLTVTSTTRAVVGIPIDSTAQTMRLEYGLRDGTAQGRAIKPTRATVRVKSSQGGRVRCGSASSDRWESLSYPLATLTYSGGVVVNLSASNKNDGTVTVNHWAPWPMVLTGLILRVDVGDDPGHQWIDVDSAAS